MTSQPRDDIAPEDRDRAKSASIWDVARVAGVSHQTVSRVINGGARVSEHTRAKVLNAIAELGYRPNRLAQALAGGAVRSVTVLTSDTSLYGASATLRGMEVAAREAGFSVGISVLEQASTTEQLLGRLSRPGEAVMVIAFDALGVQALHALPPDVAVTAVVECPSEPPVEHEWQVWLDDRAAAARATRYLLSLGHETVHYMAIPSSTSVITQRALGWRNALEEAGAIIPEPVQCGWTPRSGYLAAKALLAYRSVTAILCGNDDLALGAMRAAREYGRDIPGDVSIVGFDDCPSAAYFNPSLTTVRLDFTGLGRACFALLHRRLGPTPTPSRPVWEEPALIVRESTGPAPHP